MLTSSLAGGLATSRGTLLEELESALLGLVAGCEEELLGGLGTESMLATADNPAMLVLHEILLCEATSRLIHSSVPYLCL